MVVKQFGSKKGRTKEKDIQARAFICPELLDGDAI